MNYIWYEPLLEALRHHIEQNHMNEDGALGELQFTEEYLSYAHFGDDEKVKIGCPFSQHCQCDWEIEGHITFKLERVK
jgi:hypothetical protein